ncbi:MAG: secondary thiamine-phosphate synthase enzyme YjbQ [Candidatus Dormibacter sp.]
MRDAGNRALRLVGPGDDARQPRVRRVGGLTFWAETLVLRTAASREFTDVTALVAGVVERSGVVQGTVTVFSKHTTAAVVLNENEPLLLQDMGAMLERISGSAGVYEHNDMSRRTGEMEPNECANGHAHCQHLLIGGSQTIPVADAGLDLGHWQRIFLLELDRPRERQVVVQVFGA